MRNIYIGLAMVIFSALPMHAQKIVDISGTWSFAMDKTDQGAREQWFMHKDLDDTIKLPGSMPERMKGDKVTLKTKWIGSLYDSSYYYNPSMERYRNEANLKFPFFLTPNRHYVGLAWYNRTFDMPEDVCNRPIILFLERPHIATRVWLNGIEQSGIHTNSLCVPHEYILKGVQPKNNILAIRVDNRIETVPVGIDSHSVTDQTQGDWNGIVGRMELQIQERINISSIKVYPEDSVARIHLVLNYDGKQHGLLQGNIILSAEEFNGAKQIHPITKRQKVTLKNGTYEGDIILEMGKNVQYWDEFSPSLYRLNAKVEIGNDVCEQKVVFGMRKFEARGKMFYINGRKTILRGTVENCDFPLTGYAPMDLASWLRIFQICKQYGLNHMRFHSFCPPEVAFEAADLTGFYLQVEGPSWPNHGIKLGKGAFIDHYLMEEARAMNEVYGNHPSFCMMAAGNEPAGNWVPWCSAFVDSLKTEDARRLYTGASVGGGWAWQPRSQYHVKAGARGLNEWNRHAPESMYDFRNKIDTVSNPYIAHEMGQWCAFPDFSEIVKYTGVTRAKNFEIFRDLLSENGMRSMDRKFLMASGKLQTLCYKNEIERVLRTPNYAGFQLLALNDYSGQGTALVGSLNVFWNTKGYVTSNEYKEFCAPVVVLARLPKFTFFNDDSLTVNAELCNFGNRPLSNVKINMTLSDSSSHRVDSLWATMNNSVPIGNNIPLGSWSIGKFLKKYSEPTKLTLRITLYGNDGEKDNDSITTNHWNIWVYPRTQETEIGKIYICDSLNAKALKVLQKGGKVLICAGNNVRYGKDVVQSFLPVFWNTSWFKMRPPHTTGLYIQSEHPLFRSFPTDDHSDMQWWELVNKQSVMQFTDFPKDFQPIVQSIDTWFISRKIGMLFEANVLKGRLMMTTMPIKDASTAVTKQMYKAIIDYMNSKDFNPAYTIAPELIGGLFTKDAPKINLFTKESPDELKPKLKH